MNDQQKTIDHTLYLLLALCGALVFLPLVAMFAVNYTQYLTAAASHQEQLSKYKGFDLQAQQEMAFWTKAMFYMSLAHIFLSAIGIFFVWRSLALNREAVGAAIATNETARKIGMAETKAYLVSEGGRFSIQDDLLHIDIKLKNVGKSPAIQVFIEGKASIPSILDEHGTIISEQFNTDESVGQSNSIQVEATETGWIRLNIEGVHPLQKASIGNGARFTYTLQVFWKDVFGVWDGLTYVGDGFAISLLGTEGEITHSNVLVTPNLYKMNK